MTKNSSIPAATEAHGLSHTLRRAVSSRYPTPLPWHLTVVAYALALLVPSCFYLGPLMLMMPPIIYVWYPRAAIVLLVIDVALVIWPASEWPWFRGVFQLWYGFFDFKHNLLGPEKGPAPLDKGQRDGLTILAMHPVILLLAAPLSVPVTLFAAPLRLSSMV